METLNTMALEQMVQDVIDGNENPLKAYGILKMLENKIGNYVKEIEDSAKDEAEKFNSNTFEDSGFIFEKRKGGKVYDFKGIAEFDIATSHLNSVKEKYKTLGGSPDEETGELLPSPKITYRKDSLIVKNK